VILIVRMRRQAWPCSSRPVICRAGPYCAP